MVYVRECIYGAERQYSVNGCEDLESQFLRFKNIFKVIYIGRYIDRLEMNSATEISPTLAEFFKVPYHTKMNEEDIVVGIWNYVIEHKLFIDSRVIVLDDQLRPVVHPYFYWKDNKCKTEDSIVLVYIAKMHIDPEFIERDVQERLLRIKRNIAARKIVKFIRSHMKLTYDQDRVWLKYLVGHYGSNGSNGYKGYHCNNGYYGSNNGGNNGDNV